MQKNKAPKPSPPASNQGPEAPEDSAASSNLNVIGTSSIILPLSAETSTALFNLFNPYPVPPPNLKQIYLYNTSPNLGQICLEPSSVDDALLQPKIR